MNFCFIRFNVSRFFKLKKLILLFSFGLMVFVKAEIDYECLRCVFCFRNKEKERETFCNNFYSTILLQSCFFSPQSLNWIIIMVMCVQFIIVVFLINSLLTKFYYNYSIIYVQHSLKSFYIKHYNIIRASHGQLTSLDKPEDNVFHTKIVYLYLSTWHRKIFFPDLEGKSA